MRVPALEAYWDAAGELERIIGTELVRPRPDWIEGLAVVGGNINDEQLDLFIETVAE